MAIAKAIIPALLISCNLYALAHAQNVELPKLDLPGISNYAPAERKLPLQGIDAGILLLEAFLTAGAEPINDGMVWRIFGTIKNADGKLPLIAVAKGGSTRLEVAPGSYLIHAAFGRAGATSRVTIGTETKTESIVLNAGGLRLNAVLPDGSVVRENKLTFDIYSKVPNSTEDQLVLPDVPANKTIRLNAGTYHVVSKYGAVNAVTRADLRVEAGRTTEASLEHRAAQLSLNLVRTQNGFPLADTAWSVLSQSGEIIREDVTAVPTMILSAGEYTVIAKNKDKIYQQDIVVVSGRDQTIRIETTPVNEITAQ